MIDRMDIRPADPARLIQTLSGGNQQKVILGRWLCRDPKVLILDEPTQGIDIGTKAQIYRLVMDLAAAHVLALEAMTGEGCGGAFNLGNGDGFSVREVIAKAAEVTGGDIEVEEGPRRPGDSPALVASSEKARRVLGWKPEFDDKERAV